MERKRMGAPPLDRDLAEQTIQICNECLSEGFLADATHKQGPGFRKEAATRLGITGPTLMHRLTTIKRVYNMEPDLTLSRSGAPGFTIQGLPPHEDMSAEDIIGHLKTRSAKRIEAADARKLINVDVHMDGPVGLAMFGDPHVDDDGTDWNALERDVSLVRETPGIMAVNLGDSSNNWVGRLMGLYAHQETTRAQAMKLIEWLITSIPWVTTIGGNHDLWGSEHADAIEIMHHMRELPGLYQAHGARLNLRLPGGAQCRVHVRHDFPGKSQYNAAHALVRETLFSHRDHILGAGHRHQAGYHPTWFNDPPIMCHGCRVGSYKRIDDYSAQKHFKPENWTPAMMAIIDPDFADDPLRFVHICYTIEEGVEYLNWRRSLWSRRKSVRLVRAA